MQELSGCLPEAGEGKRGEDGHIGYLLRQAFGASRLAIERALDDLNVTSPQFSVLTLVNAYPGTSGADLARLLQLTPQTVSVIVANLEKHGAIVRRPHPLHGRVQQIAISATGRALVEACRARVAELEEGWLAGLSPDEERVIRRWLVRLATPAG